ncbi:MAG: rhomboid family intramembrane serine protease [Bacteroidia bacterium]|nr:rhomboid family intramembrane serine protease [Bacteroidia bacterium]
MELLDSIRDAPVAYFFLLITLATTLYEFYADASLRERFLLAPYQVWHDREWYRLFTCTLVHADIAHLAFNGITLYYFGPALEDIFRIRFGDALGSVAFGGLYVLAMLGAHLPDTLRHRHNPTYRALGASGAISAVLFSYILYQPDARLLVFFVIPLTAWLFAILYVGISLYADRFSRGDGIAHGAHLWGALSGWVLTALIDPWAYVRFVDYLSTRLG